MLDWIALTICGVFGIITNDMTYFVIALLWQIWSELMKIRRKME